MNFNPRQIACNCNTSMDIRARCLPNTTHRHDNHWDTCSARCETAYWLMGNEYDAYKIAEMYGFKSKQHKKFCMKTFKISEKDWVNILEIYNDDEDKHRED